MSFISKIFGGDSTSTTNIPPPTEEERRLTALSAELAQKQLDSINQLQPFQLELLKSSQADLNRTNRLNSAMDAAITPEMQAQQARAEFDRNQRLGPMQDEMLKLQLDQLRQGGRATPEQIQQIKEATDASIAAGTNDINTQTSRGIGLISDELANSRGLRLSDSPIKSEAALLTRAGNDQIGSLTTNLRANQANAVLNFPLAAQGVQSGINQSQQGLNQAAQNFQNQLRQQAYTNRLAMTGTAQSGGIGIASIGPGNSALSALTNSRMAGATTNSSRNPSLADWGALAGGIGALAAFSDRRLKKDYGIVGETKKGLPLHLYRYKNEDESDPLRLGVMSDEVRELIPHAVMKHSSGFDVVRYDMVS